MLMCEKQYIDHMACFDHILSSDDDIVYKIGLACDASEVGQGVGGNLSPCPSLEGQLS